MFKTISLLLVLVTASFVEKGLVAQQKKYKAPLGPYSSSGKEYLEKRKVAPLENYPPIKNTSKQRIPKESIPLYPVIEGVDIKRKHYETQKGVSDQSFKKNLKPNSYLFPDVNSQNNIFERNEIKNFFTKEVFKGRSLSLPSDDAIQQQNKQPMSPNFWDIEANLYEDKTIYKNISTKEYPPL